METIKSVKADLENKKFFFREIGLIVALVAVFLAFNIKTAQKKYSDADYKYQTNVTEELVPVTVQETPPPPLSPPPPQTTKISIVANDVEVEEDIDDPGDEEINEKKE